MIEQDNGEYKESSNNTWPNDMYFNEELSGCIDNLGNKIENALTYENGIANVETSDTSYCVLYFNKTTNLYQLCKNYENINECETKENLENVKGIWYSTLEDDGYRYVGTNPDNYICFGTTNTSECTSDTDKYMYRIIGIFEDSDGTQHLKLIKKEALNESYKWHSTESSIPETEWEISDLYQGINGSYFLTNNIYWYMQDLKWANKIELWNYIVSNSLAYDGGIYYYFNSAKTIYLHEMNKNDVMNEDCYGNSNTIINCSIGTWKSVNSKIGLKYASDHNLSLGNESLNLTGADATVTLKTGWMHITNNDSGAPSTFEWTMTRVGVDSYNDNYAWAINVNGNVAQRVLYESYSVRPTFYLTENIKITSGKGSVTEPFIIS